MLLRGREAGGSLSYRGEAQALSVVTGRVCCVGRGARQSGAVYTLTQTSLRSQGVTATAKSELLAISGTFLFIITLSQ